MTAPCDPVCQPSSLRDDWPRRSGRPVLWALRSGRGGKDLAQPPGGHPQTRGDLAARQLWFRLDDLARQPPGGGGGPAPPGGDHRIRLLDPTTAADHRQTGWRTSRRNSRRSRRRNAWRHNFRRTLARNRGQRNRRNRNPRGRLRRRPRRNPPHRRRCRRSHRRATGDGLGDRCGRTRRSGQHLHDQQQRDRRPRRHGPGPDTGMGGGDVGGHRRQNTGGEREPGHRPHPQAAALVVNHHDAGYDQHPIDAERQGVSNLRTFTKRQRHMHHMGIRRPRCDGGNHAGRQVPQCPALPANHHNPFPFRFHAHLDTGGGCDAGWRACDTHGPARHGSAAARPGHRRCARVTVTRGRRRTRTHTNSHRPRPPTPLLWPRHPTPARIDQQPRRPAHVSGQIPTRPRRSPNHTSGSRPSCDASDQQRRPHRPAWAHLRRPAAR